MNPCAMEAKESDVLLKTYSLPLYLKPLVLAMVLNTNAAPLTCPPEPWVLWYLLLLQLLSNRPLHLHHHYLGCFWKALLLLSSFRFIVVPLSKPSIPSLSASVRFADTLPASSTCP